MGTPSRELQPINEYRKAWGLVAAEIITDNAEKYVTGDVFSIAGLSQVTKSVQTNTATHFFDNYGAVIVVGIGAETVTLDVSALPLDVYAYISGYNYDADLDAVIEGTRKTRYFAVGYKAGRTDGGVEYVWKYKCRFNVPDMTSRTDDDSTDANGQQLVVTAIRTTHKFTKSPDEAGNPGGASGYNINATAGLADLSTFFDRVTTPDDVQPLTPVTMYSITNTLTHCTTNNAATSIASGNAYAATITADTGYTLGAVTVTMGGTDISSTAVSGGAITVPAVTGALVITATATED